MKKTAGPLRTQLAQFRELEAFSRFSSDLDAVTLNQLALGRSLMRIMRQPPNQPVDVDKQVALLFAGTKRYLVKVPDNRMTAAIQAVYDAINNTEEGKAYAIRFSKLPEMDNELQSLLEKVLEKTLAPFIEA